jgi:hypothetical protein
MYVGLVIYVVIAVGLMYLFLKPSDTPSDTPPRPSKKFGEGLFQDCDGSIWGANASDTWGPDKRDL